MQTRQGLLFLLCLSGPLLAEEPPPEPSPQLLQVSQQRLGEQASRLGENLEELLEEAQANLGVELQDFDTFRHTRERLAELSDRQMPSICSELREPTTRALYTAWRRQDEIAGELNHLLLAVRRHLAPAMSRRGLARAMDCQKEALRQTRDLHASFPDLEGLSEEVLTEEQMQALAAAAEMQAQAAEELVRTQAEMKRQYDALAGGDLAAREMLKRAQNTFDRAAVAAQAAAAAEDLKRNHTRQAEEKQESILNTLRAADQDLAPPSAPAARSEDRLKGLQEAVGQQAQALDETTRLEKGRSEEDLLRAARDQGEVSKQLHDLAVQQPDLKHLQAASETAKQKLVDGDLAAARQSQEKALKALQEALKEAAGELALAQRQASRSTATALELDPLLALLRRQDELSTRTRLVSAERAHALAREQADLARTTAALAAADRPPTLKTPPTEKLVESIRVLSQQAQVQAEQCARKAEQHLAETRQSVESNGEVSEELDPETFYGLREMLNQAQGQAADAKRAAQETATAAGEVVKLATTFAQKHTPSEARVLALRLAYMALRATAAGVRAARIDEDRQDAALLQSQALQTAAWLQTLGLPKPAESLQTAARAMDQATAELANQQPAQALPRQVEACAALESAIRRLMAELGQSNLATAIGMLRDGTASLAEAQARLTAETARGDASADELKPRQETLRCEADRLKGLPTLPGEALEALTHVSENMQKAVLALQHSTLPEARKAQEKATTQLAHALYALRQAATAAQLAPPGNLDTGARPGRQPAKKDLPPAVEMVAPPPLAAPAWDVALPPRERAEVNQALKEVMPARYRQQIARYYENLARAGLE